MADSSSRPVPDAIARDLLSEADQEQITLRIGGSLAVRLHCHASDDLLDRWQREPPGDVDLFGYSRQDPAIQGMFRRLGWTLDPAVALSREWGVNRLVYHGPDGAKTDVFLDTLNMAHEVDFKQRLELAAPTLPLADLLLTKLQIHELTAKDVKDVGALLAGHDLAETNEAEAIEIPRVTRLLAHDWGFWYTALRNLEAVATFVGGNALDSSMRDRTLGRVDALRRRIEAEPKTRRWRLRARVGPRVQWYQDVNLVEDGGF
jgi:hypothetical protein